MKHEPHRLTPFVHRAYQTTKLPKYLPTYKSVVVLVHVFEEASTHVPVGGVVALEIQNELSNLIRDRRGYKVPRREQGECGGGVHAWIKKMSSFKTSIHTRMERRGHWGGPMQMKAQVMFYISEFITNHRLSPVTGKART